VALLFSAGGFYPPAIDLANELLVSAGTPPLPQELAGLFFPIAHEEVVRAEAARNGLDPLLLFALIKQESAYGEGAVSPAGALGLMQLMPTTAESLSRELSEPPPVREDLLSSPANVRLGARYLAKLLSQFKGNLFCALAAYNAGPQRVTTWQRNWGTLPFDAFVELIPLEETRNYVKSIVRNYVFYAQLLENRKVDAASLAKLAQE
jgi:soluble lytic murein transglycosylase